MKGPMVAQPVRTTCGEVFTATDSEMLAALILRRFGYDVAAAASAWRRLLLNSCPDESFAAMAAAGRLLARSVKD